MAEVTILCPRTGQRVPTGFEIDQKAFHSLRPVVSRMRCPACGSEHAWSKAIAQLGGAPSASRRHAPCSSVKEERPFTASTLGPEALSKAARRAISLGAKFGLR